MLDMKLALGRADIYSELRAIVTGIKAGTDGTRLASEVTHSLDRGGGFSTVLRLEMS